MKKLVLIAAALAAVCGIVMAGTTVSTNSLGQVITATTSATGVTITITDPNAGPSITNRTVEAVGFWLDKASSTTSANYTPRNYGDMLIGYENGTSKVWIATGLTTTNWTAIVDP